MKNNIIKFFDSKIIVTITLALVSICLILAVHFVKNQNPAAIEHPFHLVLGTSKSVNSSLINLADRKGYFKKRNIKVEIKYYQSASIALNRMLNDKIHIACSAETPIAFKYFDRDDFSVFATVNESSNDPKIIARKDMGIVLPADLVGKKIGSTPKGQSANFFLNLFLLKHNIDLSQIEIVYDSPDNLVNRIVSGELPAVCLFEPFAYQATGKLTQNHNVFEEKGLYYKTFNISSKNDFMINNEKHIVRFIQALIDAEHFFSENKKEAIDLITHMYSIDKKALNNYLKDSSFDVNLSSSLIDTIKDQASWIKEDLKLVKKDLPDFTKVINSKYLRKVDKSRVSINSTE